MAVTKEHTKGVSREWRLRFGLAVRIITITERIAAYEPEANLEDVARRDKNKRKEKSEKLVLNQLMTSILPAGLGCDLLHGWSTVEVKRRC